MNREDVEIGASPKIFDTFNGREYLRQFIGRVIGIINSASL